MLSTLRRSTAPLRRSAAPLRGDRAEALSELSQHFPGKSRWARWCYCGQHSRLFFGQWALVSGTRCSKATLVRRCLGSILGGFGTHFREVVDRFGYDLGKISFFVE